ncbi:hypothetical protein BCR39DRAFT_525569 [Naematelia encephala]|uniref:Uncharacterized protein n=1 Tax=Naematelia encephala TaxID=71784 RepID=A0A1Y2BAP7_9TREE|nr:hypothetical protein BCR39DRAFT_525569 [Naematelia encephala]
MHSNHMLIKKSSMVHETSQQSPAQRFYTSSSARHSSSLVGRNVLLGHRGPSVGGALALAGSNQHVADRIRSLALTWSFPFLSDTALHITQSSHMRRRTLLMCCFHQMWRADRVSSSTESGGVQAADWISSVEGFFWLVAFTRVMGESSAF